MEGWLRNSIRRPIDCTHPKKRELGAEPGAFRTAGIEASPQRRIPGRVQVRHAYRFPPLLIRGAEFRGDIPIRETQAQADLPGGERKVLERPVREAVIGYDDSQLRGPLKLVFNRSLDPTIRVEPDH